MATYRKKLLDKDGNTIIPAMAGDETGWVKTADIAGGAVTPAKFAQYAVNEAVKTGANLVPTADMPKAWEALLGDNGYWVTPYSSNVFTNQPSQYGILETIISTGGVYQRWTKSGSGEIYHRSGLGYSSTDQWWGSSSAAGTFRMIDDNTYSTSETLCGTWIDGSPIYKTTVDLGEFPNAAQKVVYHGISGIDKIIKIEAEMHNQDYSSTRPLPYADPDGVDYAVGIIANRIVVDIYTGRDRSGFSGYATLYYTKSS